MWDPSSSLLTVIILMMGFGSIFQNFDIFQSVLNVRQGHASMFKLEGTHVDEDSVQNLNEEWNKLPTFPFINQPSLSLALHIYTTF